MIDQIFNTTKDKMHKTVEAVVRELNAVRTGKASAHLLDTIRVDAYGTQMHLNQVATVSVPEPRMIVITPFDKTVSGEIVKAIQKSDLGLNPMPESGMIRVPIPALNEERRRDLVKHCKHIAEEGRVAIRNIRREANDHVKKELKDKKITEDQEKEAHDKVQKMTDEYIKEIDGLFAKKEREVLEV